MNSKKYLVKIIIELVRVGAVSGVFCRQKSDCRRLESKKGRQGGWTSLFLEAGHINRF
jgi:hypothetical protein